MHDQTEPGIGGCGVGQIQTGVATRVRFEANKDGKKMIDVLPTGNIVVGEKMMDIEKAIIHDAFLVTLFQILIDTPQMTATEVLQRAQEKGMLLAPTAGRMQAEFLGQLTSERPQCLRCRLRRPRESRQCLLDPRRRTTKL